MWMCQNVIDSSDQSWILILVILFFMCVVVVWLIVFLNV